VNGVEGIRFLSAGPAFKVSLGSSPASPTSGQYVGPADGNTGTNGGAVLSSAQDGAGSTADISNISTAQAAVAALSEPVGWLIAHSRRRFRFGIGRPDKVVDPPAARALPRWRRPTRLHRRCWRC